MSALPQTFFQKAPLFVLAIAICCGIVVQQKLPTQSGYVLFVSTAIAIGLTMVSIVALSQKRLSIASAAFVAVFICTGFIIASINDRPPSADRVSRLLDERSIASGEPVELIGKLQGEAEPGPQGLYLTLQARQIRIKGAERPATGTVVLLARISGAQAKSEYEALELRHGARIRVMTSLDREDDFRNPGVLRFTEYLETRGYDATGVIKSPLLVERLEDEAVFLPLAWLYQWRAHLAKELSEKFSAETGAVLNAALLGNSRNISSASAERFRAGGTFHILVISGLQIAFIAGLVLLIARRITTRKFLQFVVATAFLWAYAIAVGAESSVTRAALMFTVAAFAPVVERQAASLNTIGAAALVLVVWNPSEVFDPSFQLTFLSVLAIVCVAVPVLRNMQRVGSWRPTMVTPYPPECPPWFRTLAECLFWSEREWKAEMATSHIRYRLFKTRFAARFERWHLQKLLRFGVAAVVVSASVQLVLLPAMILYFHRVSIASLALNIFVGALMVVLAFSALGALLLSQVSSWLATPLILLAEKANWFMIHLVDPFSSVGLASIRVPHYTGWSALIYVVYFVLLGVLVFSLTRWNPLSLRLAGNRIRTKVLAGASSAFVIVFATVVFHAFSSAGPDGRLRVDFLDVGQGDSALLTLPDGTTVLIDGGGRPNINWDDVDAGDRDEAFEGDSRSIGERVVSEYLWSRGLDRVDYIVATHADADHIDGLNDIARNFKVRAAIVTRAPATDREFGRFLATMKRNAVPVHIVGAGDRMKIGNVELDILWPRPTTDTSAGSGNDDSLVMRVRLGDRSFLFTGDVEKKAEALVVNEGLDLRSDIVKVAHHGSRTSSVPAFVNAVHPTLAVISVGRTSMFGHPHQEVVERWRASGAEVMTTGEKGTISVVTDGRDLKVSTFLRE